MEALARIIEEGGELPPLPATEVRAVQPCMPQMIVPRLPQISLPLLHHSYCPESA